MRMAFRNDPTVIVYAFVFFGVFPVVKGVNDTRDKIKGETRPLSKSSPQQWCGESGLPSMHVCGPCHADACNPFEIETERERKRECKV